MFPHGSFYALCAIGLWSTNAVVARFVLIALPVEQVQFLQFLGACGVFAYLRLRADKSDRHLASTRARWGLGAVGLAGTMIFQYIAFSIGPITEVNIVAYGWPLITAVFLVMFGSIKRPLQLLGLAVLGFAGVVLLIGGNPLDGSLNLQNLGGVFAAVISAVCMAVFSFGMTKIKCDGNDVLFPGAIIGLAITAAWCLMGHSTWNVPIPILLGLYLGIGPMGIGYLLWSHAMQKDQSGHVALLGFLTPFTSTLLLLMAGETLTVVSLLGGSLCLLASTCVSYQTWSRRHV